MRAIKRESPLRQAAVDSLKSERVLFLSSNRGFLKVVPFSGVIALSLAEAPPLSH